MNKCISYDCSYFVLHIEIFPALVNRYARNYIAEIIMRFVWKKPVFLFGLNRAFGNQKDNGSLYLNGDIFISISYTPHA